ncbi:MAG: hypothetical protein QCI82_02760 [Candidatus Thermoplasmatota archaeon]|nr:hypothetical protein [Candidatus Thermoplasmatota archaeon]
MDLAYRPTDILSILKKNRRLQLKFGATIYLMISLVLSLGDGPVYSVGWFLFGIIGLSMLYKLTPRFFFLGIWMIIVYLLTFIGSMVKFKYAEISGSWFLSILGYMILIGAFILLLYLVLFVKERRDQYARWSDYVPIGLWFIFSLIFFWSSLFSIIGWIRWSDKTAGTPLLNMFLYFIAGSIMLITLIFVITFPEERFKTTYDDLEHSESMMKSLKSFIMTATGRKLKIDDSIREVRDIKPCPLCGMDLDREIKKCPTCDTPRFFYSCRKSKDLFVRCPNCAELTPIGRDRCLHCSTRIIKMIRCSNCSSVHEIHRWIE